MILCCKEIKEKKHLPRMGEDETPRGLFCTRLVRVIDGAVVVAEMVAISFSVTLVGYGVRKPNDLDYG